MNPVKDFSDIVVCESLAKIQAQKAPHPLQQQPGTKPLAKDSWLTISGHCVSLREEQDLLRSIP